MAPIRQNRGCESREFISHAGVLSVRHDAFFVDQVILSVIWTRIKILDLEVDPHSGPVPVGTGTGDRGLG